MKNLYKVEVLNRRTLELATYEGYPAETATQARRNVIRRLQRNGFLERGDKYEVTIWWKW